MTESKPVASWKGLTVAIVTALSAGLGAGTQIHIGPTQDREDPFARLEEKIDRYAKDQMDFIKAIGRYQRDLANYVDSICEPNCPEKDEDLLEESRAVRAIVRK